MLNENHNLTFFKVQGDLSNLPRTLKAEDLSV